MEVIKMAANPLDGICYTEYDAESDSWLGPSGAGMLLTHELERRLNFTSQLIYSDNKGGNLRVKLDAKTGQRITFWDGMIGKLIAGEADWSPCYVTRSLSRDAVVHFSPTAFIVTRAQVLLPMPTGVSKSTLTVNSVLLPFDGLIWLWIILSLITYSLLTVKIDTCRVGKLGQCDRFISRLATQLIRHVCSIMNHYYSLKSVTEYATIWTFWIFAAMILQWLYGGDLLSYFTSAAEPDLVTSWPDLIHRYAANKLFITVFRGGRIETIARSLFDPHGNQLKLCSQMTDCFNFVTGAETHDVSTKVLFEWSRIIKLAAARYGMRTFPVTLGAAALRRGQAEFYTVDSQLPGSVVGFAFSKHRVDLLARFQPWLVRFTESGLLDQWHAASERQLAGFYRSERNSDNSRATIFDIQRTEFMILTISDTCGSYVTYAACFVLTVISLAFECFY